MRSTIGSLTIECVRGDITAQPDLDAVVNAANARLAPGGGVAGAIHRAAGPGLYEECRALAPIAAGEAVITSGHGLPNPWVIHTLGPVYGQSSDPAGRLASCYRSCLERAEERGLVSVGFCAVSTGIFGYPPRDAAQVAVRTIAEASPSLRSVRLVRFVLFSEHDLDVLSEAVRSLTPP